MAALLAVFNTFELLEQILTHLPLADLLTASRVCKICRSMIEKSLPIRRIFFGSELPGKVLPNGTPINTSKTSLWIFRTGLMFWPTVGVALPGQFLVFATPTTRFIVFRPRDPSKDLVSHGNRLSVTPSTREWDRVGSWTVHLDSGDGEFVGCHTLRETFKGDSVFLAYVKTFYRKGGDWEDLVEEWRRASRRVFGDHTDGKRSVGQSSQTKKTGKTGGFWSR